MRTGGGGLWWAVPLLVLLSLYSARAATCPDATPQTLAPSDNFTLTTASFAVLGFAPGHEHCIWTLPLLSENAVHAVTFKAGTHIQASVDYIKIYDGANVSAPLLVGYRLYVDHDATVYSTSGNITVEYLSGGVLEETVRGFLLVTEAVERWANPTVAAQNVSRDLVATLGQAAVVRAPYNDSFSSSGIAYPRNIVATFTITSPPGTVVRLALANISIANGDSIIIYDNDTRGSVLETLAGTPNWPMVEIFSSATTGVEATAIGGRIVVKFVSSSRHKYGVFYNRFMSGFVFEYMAWENAASTSCGPNVTVLAVNASGVAHFPQPLVQIASDPESGPYRSFVTHSLPGGAICRFRLEVAPGFAMRLNSISTGADFRVWSGPNRTSSMVPPTPFASRPNLVPLGVYGNTFYIEAHTGSTDRLDIDYSVVSAQRCELSPAPLFTAPNGIVALSHATGFLIRTPNVTCTARIQVAGGSVIRISNVTLEGEDYLDVFEINGNGTTFYARITPSMLPLNVFHSNGSNIRLVYVAGRGSTSGLELAYEAIPAPSRPATYHAVAASPAGTIAAAVGPGYQMPWGTYTWNITANPGSRILFPVRKLNLRMSDQVWIYDGTGTSGEILGHYTGVTDEYADLISVTSNVVVVLITGASLFSTIPLYDGFSFDFQQTNAPAPDFDFPRVMNYTLASGACQFLLFPDNLPLARRYTVNITVAEGESANGFKLDIGKFSSFYFYLTYFDEVTDVYQLDGTSWAWRVDNSAFALQPYLYTYGRSIVLSMSTGDHGQRCDRAFWVTAVDDVIHSMSYAVMPACSGTTMGTYYGFPAIDVVPCALAYWKGMHCEWILTPDPGEMFMVKVQAYYENNTPGADFSFTDVGTNETFRLSDQAARDGWPYNGKDCTRYFTFNSTLLVSWRVSDDLNVLPLAVPRIRIVPFNADELPVRPALTTLTGRAGDTFSVSAKPPSPTGDSTADLLWRTPLPFEYAYHLVGRRDSSWTALYGDPDITAWSSSLEEADLPWVRVYNGSDATAPLLYDSRIDRLPLDDPLGLKYIPAGLTTGPDAYIRFVVDNPSGALAPFHAKYFRNSVGTASCSSVQESDPVPYEFIVGTQNIPGRGCEVTLPAARALNMYAMAVVDGGTLQPGEFVSVFTDDVLTVKYGHAHEATEVGVHLNGNFWLPTVTTGIRILFEAPPQPTGFLLPPGRVSFQLNFTLSVPPEHESPALVGWSIYGPYSEIHMCGDLARLNLQLHSQADADKWQECTWFSRLAVGVWDTSDYTGDLFMPNVTWVGDLMWRGSGTASFPNLAYVDNCLGLYKSDIQAGALQRIGSMVIGAAANMTILSLKRTASLGISQGATSLAFPALEYVGAFVIPSGSQLVSLTLGNNTKFGSIVVPGGLLFTMTFPYDLEVETSVDMTSVRVLGNLTLTGTSAYVSLVTSQGMPWIILPNATVAEILVNGCPNVTTISAPATATVYDLQLTNSRALNQVLLPSVTAIAVTNIVLEDLPSMSSLPNISTASVNIISLSIKRTALKKWETLNTQRLDSLTMIDNPEVDSIRVCGTTLQSVNIVDAPQLSCDGVNLTLSGYLVPSYSVTGCGAFASTDQPCIPPPPVPQPPATPGCVDPGVPSNGDQYLDSGSFVYDTTVNASVYTTGAQMSFACDYGYRLLGHVVITCRVSGRWSGAAPTCEVDTGALIQPTLGDFTPTLIPLRTVVNVSLVAAQINLPLRSIDTHDGDVRTGDDQWWIDPNGGSARRRVLLGSTQQMSFTVAPRVEASYLIVTVEDGYGLQATDDTSVYFTDDCPTPGTFGIGLDCHPCPEGGFCPGGNRVWPLPGYWNEGETSGHVLACPEKTACLGGRYSSCAPGYHGPLCAACDAHFYLRGTECAVCPPKQEETAIYIAAGIFFPLLALAFCTLPDLALDVVIIILKVLQLVRAGSTQGGARLPEGFKQFTFYLSLVTFDFEFIKPTCSFLEDYPYFYTLFWGNGVIAAMLIVPSFLLLSILRLAHKSRREFYVNRTYRAVTIQLSLLYYVIAVRTMQSVTCIRIGNDQRLLADPTIPCADNYTVQIVGGLGLAAFTSGVPIAAAYLVNRLARKGLWRNKRVEARYGFLFSDLNMTSRKHFYVVLPYLQLMFASIAWTVLKVGVAPYILNIVALMILLLTSVIVQPFARGIGNAIAVLSYGLGLAAVVIGLCSLGEDPATLLVGWSLGGIIALFALVMTVLFVFKDIRDSKLRKANIIEPLKDASGIDSLSSAKYLESSMMTTPILESTVTSSMDDLTSTKLPVVSPSISLTVPPGGGLERQGTLTHASLIVNNGLAGMLRHESTVVSSAASSVGLRNTPVSSEDFDTGHVPGLVNQDPLDFRYFPRESTTSETTPEPGKARPPSP